MGCDSPKLVRFSDGWYAAVPDKDERVLYGSVCNVRWLHKLKAKTYEEARVEFRRYVEEL